jgi:hydrogenase expression/formation protein HypC
MCLAVPAKVIEVKPAGGEAPLGPLAVLDLGGSRIEASLAMTPQAAVGDWVLVHAGFALSVLDEAEAQATWDALTEALGEGANPQIPPMQDADSADSE